MSNKTDLYTKELEELIQGGKELLLGLMYENYTENYQEIISEKHNGDINKINDEINSFINFSEEYQSWYAVAQRVVKQLLPDNYSDFISYYEYKKNRKEIDHESYSIKDYLQEITIRRYDKSIKVDGKAAIPKFQQQINILKAAKSSLSSSLLDLRGILQADLFDSEIETAEVLAKAGYLRASGAICGVVLEKHLLHVNQLHNLPVKKHPSIADLSQSLKDANYTTMAQWRFIQHLTDIRNLCDHAKGTEPTKDEISDLVAGTKKVLKTVF